MNIKWRLKINLQEFLETFCHKDKVKVWNVSSKPGNCRSRTRGLEALLTVSGWFNILSEMNTRSSEARGGLGRPLGFYFKRKHEKSFRKTKPSGDRETVCLTLRRWSDTWRVNDVNLSQEHKIKFCIIISCLHSSLTTRQQPLVSPDRPAKICDGWYCRWLNCAGW